MPLGEYPKTLPANANENATVIFTVKGEAKAIGFKSANNSCPQNDNHIKIEPIDIGMYDLNFIEIGMKYEMICISCIRIYIYTFINV